jgi:hypothetical protein
MIRCDNCGGEISLPRFLRSFLLGRWQFLPCLSCGAGLRPGKMTERFFWIVTLGGAILLGAAAIYGHDRLDWADADVLTLAIGAGIGMTTILAFVIWQIGDYTSRPSDREEEFVEEDRATRYRILGLLAVVLLLIVLERLTYPDGALRETDPVQAFKRSADRLLIVTLVSAPFWFGLSIYLLRMGIKVKRSVRYPPPGMRVAVRTKVRRGKRAKWNSILMFVFAGFFVIPPLVLLCAWYWSASLVSELGQPNKQMPPAPRNSAADLRRSDEHR